MRKRSVTIATFRQFSRKALQEGDTSSQRVALLH
jgi:hypothetical protein